MSEHEVAFHIGTGTVVCACGAHFETNRLSATLGSPVTAVAYWADHLRETSGLSLQGAYETGWSDACADWLQQQQDPSHPIGIRKRQDYPNEPTTSPHPAPASNGRRDG